MKLVIRIAVGILLTSCAAFAQDASPFTFRHAVELSLQHSTAMAIATSDTRRAAAAVKEQRSQYVPQVTVGSGLAATYGFPLSLEGAAPTAVNVNTQSLLINFAQPDFIRSAKSESNAAQLTAEDRKQLTVLDAATTYIQLATVNDELKVLSQQQDSAERTEKLVSDRVKEGVDPELESTRARLNSSKVRMRTAEAQGAAEVLRSHLAALTGLKPEEIVPLTETIPPLPKSDAAADINKIVDNSFSVKAAFEAALAKELRARGEKKFMLPAVDLVGQYGLLTRYNNYDRFFRSFQRNNVTFGVAVRFPIFNQPGRAHAEQVDQEAVRARREAEAAKQETTEQTIQLRHSVEQLAAARDVAKLSHQIARADVESAGAKVEAGLASYKDQESARVQEFDKYVDFLNADFALSRAQLQMMRVKGELQDWALGTR